jgi:hypothetical protein
MLFDFMPSQLSELLPNPLVSVLKKLGISTGAIALLGSSPALFLGSPAVNATPAPVLLAQTEAQNPETSYPPVSEGTRFACQFVEGQYMVMYYPQSQPGQAYPWATPTQMGGGWTPELRCNEISRRLESYRPDGLQAMQTGTENGYNVVCVTTQRDPACRIVLTVPPGQDPLITRDRVFENLTVADSGQQTDSVVTYTDGDGDGILSRLGEALNVDLPGLGRRRSATSDSIDLRPFLDPTDGGTGARLTRSSAQSAPRLNPDNFR